MNVDIDKILALLGEKVVRERLLETELERYSKEIERLELELQKATLPDNVTVEQVG
mgnify:CR=1 FL=1